MTRVISCFDESCHQLRIAIDGDFDDYVIEAFDKAYNNNSSEIPIQCILDFKQTTYLDSSIIGSLQQFCKYADQCGANIFVVNMNDEILSEFRILNLHKIFKPEYHRETFRVEWVYHPKFG